MNLQFNSRTEQRQFRVAQFKNKCMYCNSSFIRFVNRTINIIFRMPNDKYFESGSDFQKLVVGAWEFFKKYCFFSVLSHNKFNILLKKLVFSDLGHSLCLIIYQEFIQLYCQNDSSHRNNDDTKFNYTFISSHQRFFGSCCGL